MTALRQLLKLVSGYLVKTEYRKLKLVGSSEENYFLI
jgi:hypothetical protein